MTETIVIELRELAKVGVRQRKAFEADQTARRALLDSIETACRGLGGSWSEKTFHVPIVGVLPGTSEMWEQFASIPLAATTAGGIAYVIKHWLVQFIKNRGNCGVKIQIGKIKVDLRGSKDVKTALELVSQACRLASDVEPLLSGKRALMKLKSADTLSNEEERVGRRAVGPRSVRASKKATSSKSTKKTTRSKIRKKKSAAPK
jgi:hypothetical protein